MFQVDPIGILALTEGGISNKERTLLNHLRDSLGISPVDAEAFEHELQQVLITRNQFTGVTSN